MTQARFQHNSSCHVHIPGTHAAVIHGLRALESCLSGAISFVARADPAEPVRPLPGGPPLVLCQTSGSSGQAKTIRRSQASWIASFDVTQSVYGLGPQDHYAVLGDLSHSLTLYAVTEAFHLGAGLTLLAGLLPRPQASQIAHGVTVLYATPVQLRLLVDGARAAGLSVFPDMRAIFSGGGKLDPECYGALKRLCPNATLREFFGASETSFMSISDSDTPDGSVGRPYPGVTLEVRDDFGRVTNDVGEIWVNSPYLFQGYERGDSPDTRWDAGFLTVGEMGWLDGNGYLFLKGRKNRMVTVADQNVFPEDIEQAMLHHPLVSRCAVVPQPDPKRGHHLIAIVEGSRNPALSRDLQQLCHSTLGAVSSPRRVIYIDKMPVLPAGKTDLVTLTQWLERQP